MDYEAVRAMAEQTIMENGQAMTLRVVTGGVTQPDGTTTPVVNTDHQAQGVKRFYHEREIDGTLILRGDLQVILAASAGLPQPQAKVDKLIIGGVTWDIEDCQPVAPGDTTVIYKLQARK